MDGERWDGTTPGGSTPDARSLDDAETAPQPVLTPDLQAAAAAEAAAAAALHHHEAPHGHAPAPAPRHAATVVPDSPPARSWKRTAGVVAALLVVVGGVSAWALTRGGSTPVAQPGSSAGPSGAPTSSGSVSAIDPTAAPGITQAEPMLPPASDTLVLGDSLGLTVYPYLADLVPDRYVSYEAEVGRTTAGTLAALRQMSSIPDMVIVSSGTNDPTGEVLEADANQILDILGPERCVVWVDVVRPDSQYAPASQLNAAIDRAAEGRENVRVLQWTELVATHPDWMGGDGIHPNREGSIGRATAFGAASEACSPFDPAAPTASKQYLPLSAFYGPIAGGGSDSGSSGSGTGNGGSSAPVVSPTPTAEEPAPAPSATPSPSAPASSSAPASTPPPQTTSAPPKTSAPPPDPTATPAGGDASTPAG